MKRREFVAALGALTAITAPGLARAAPYPTKPIRMINPFPPGGTTEILARIIGVGLTKSLGQPVVIDTRPGAGGNIGLAYAARSTPDGYTIAMYPISSVMAPAIYKDLTYDPLTDLIPVALVGKMPSLLVVHPSGPFQSVKDVIAYARANPGKLDYSSAGIGTGPHFFMELFLYLTGTKMNHIPYKGAGPALIDQIAGRVPIGFQAATAVLSHIQQGKLRPLATSTLEPFEPLPSLPSVATAGVPGFEASSWFGLVAPAQTPKAIVDKLNVETLRALQLNEAKKSLAELGVIVLPNSPTDFGKFIQIEAEKWAKVAKAANITAN